MKHRKLMSSEWLYKFHTLSTYIWKQLHEQSNLFVGVQLSLVAFIAHSNESICRNCHFTLNSQRFTLTKLLIYYHIKLKWVNVFQECCVCDLRFYSCTEVPIVMQFKIPNVSQNSIIIIHTHILYHYNGDYFKILVEVPYHV